MPGFKDNTIHLKNKTSADNATAGYTRLYTKTDGSLYTKDDIGTESKLIDTTEVAAISANLQDIKTSNVTTAAISAGLDNKISNVNLYSSSASVVYGNSVTETSLIGSGLGSLSIGSNTLVAGSILRVRWGGYVKTTSTPTLILKLKIGATVIVMVSAVAAPDTGANAVPLIGIADVHVLGTGASAAVAGTFQVIFHQPYSTWGTATPLTAGHIGISSIDTTSVNVVDLTAQWGTANTNNEIGDTYFSIDQIR